MYHLKEKLTIEGKIEILIIDAKTKEVLEKKEFSNLVVNGGLNMIRAWLGNVLPIDDANINIDTRITHIAVGDSNAIVAGTQTSLGNELLRKELYPTPDPGCGISLDTNKVIYEMLLDESELNGEIIREVGLFSESHIPFMVTRFLCGNLSKTSAVQFLIKYKILINSS